MNKEIKLKFDHRSIALVFNDGENNIKRYGPDHWEKAYGESWESEYDCAKYEEAYQRLLKEDVEVKAKVWPFGGFFKRE